jgi:hypothetical protein
MGKALSYARLVGVSAVRTLIDTKDVDEFVDTVVRIAPDFPVPGTQRHQPPPTAGGWSSSSARRTPAFVNLALAELDATLPPDY